VVSSDLDSPGRLPHQQGPKRGEAGLPRRASCQVAPGPGLERTGRHCMHQGIHDRMGMQRMRREGVEGAPGLVPWRGKGDRERVCLPGA